MTWSAATHRANKVFPFHAILVVQWSERQATAGDLALSIPPTHIIRDKNFSFSIKATSDTSNDERDQIWRMFEENMYELYHSSSFGWRPQQKRTEMFDPLSRFVIAHDVSDLTKSLASSGMVAYSIFRFDREDRQNVVYCYELQVSTDSRRSGLGRLLTQILSDVGAQWGMTKVMLTVFKANQAAMLFYKSIGFAIDETSPDFSENTQDGTDYAILSRCIPRRA